jgi:hypothetical protein
VVASAQDFCTVFRNQEVEKPRLLPVPLLGVLPVVKTLNSGYHFWCPLGEVVPRIAMADPQSFLDNLRNLRLVMSVALEHIQENRNQFVKDATASQLRQVEKSISQIRTLADRIETEFNTLEYLIGKRPT